MSYGDGGFYFLQPVGNGYGGVDGMLGSRSSAYGSMGASKDPLKSAFTASQFDKIISKFKNYTDGLYKKAWGYAAFSSQRADADKAWATADRALGQLRVMKGSLKTAQWRYADLPSAVQSGIGDWIYSDVLKASKSGTLADLLGLFAPPLPAPRQITPSPGRITPGRLSPAPGRLSPLSPAAGAQVQTLMIPAPTTTMGPQAVVSEEAAVVAQAQADLSQQAAQTVSTATAAAAGGTGLDGFLSTTTGKVVTGTAVAGFAYLLWRNRRSIFGS
jgi:hypothetical protein